LRNTLRGGIEHWKTLSNNYQNYKILATWPHTVELDRSFHCGMSESQVVNKRVKSDRVFMWELLWIQSHSATWVKKCTRKQVWFRDHQTERREE
jgi:hypothetical protein